MSDLKDLTALNPNGKSWRNSPTIIDDSKNGSRYLLELNDRLIEIIQKKDEELQEIREQLEHAGKLATLGTIGVGVAHELNNPLTVVSAEADEILDAIENGYCNNDFLITCTTNIKKSAERMRRIIDYMRQHARNETNSDWKKLDINEPIKHALILLKPQLESSGIKINLNLENNLPKIWGDSTKLESVFQNLISNAKDAFEAVTDHRKKQMTLSTQIDESDHVVAKIKDNACGMSHEVKAKLFKPFFTTKAKGRGTGLGLTISRRLLKDHKAIMLLESQEGEGAEFILQFPVDRRNNVD